MTLSVIPTLDFGDPITPTPAEVSAAYSRTGALLWWRWTRLVRWLERQNAAPEEPGIGDGLDAARGIINATIIGGAVFLAFAVVVLS